LTEFSLESSEFDSVLYIRRPDGETVGTCAEEIACDDDGNNEGALNTEDSMIRTTVEQGAPLWIVVDSLVVHEHGAFELTIEQL
jgi:hypothetical protein